jgi:hypothetical protein
MMEKSVLDNANPTILSLSQLPSRRLKQVVSRPGPESKYDDFLFPRQAPDWGLPGSVSSWSSDDDDDIRLTEEAIDEQEIYGEFVFPIAFLPRTQQPHDWSCRFHHHLGMNFLFICYLYISSRTGE